MSGGTELYISCCTPIRQCQMAAEAGFDRVVLSAWELANIQPDALKTLKQYFESRALECRALNDFCPPELKLCGPDYRPELVKRYMEHLAPRAALLGVEQIGVGAPLSRYIPEGFPQDFALEQMQTSLDLAARMCRPYGIQILLEPICRAMTNLLNNTPEVLALVKRCEEPVGIVYDIFHAWMMNEPPADALPAMNRIGIVHIAHAQNGRRLPTAETITQYQSYFQMLLDANYQGELSIEAQLEEANQSQLAQSCQALRQIVTSHRTSLRY